MPTSVNSVSNQILASGNLTSLLPSSTVTSVGTSTNNGSLASTLALSGLASGMNWQNTVQQLANAERAPETQWQTQQSKINSQNSAFGTIKTYLTALQTDMTTLADPTLYNSATAQSSNSAVAAATAAPGATQGSYSFVFSQLATAAQWNGTANVSQKLSPDGNLNNVTIGTAGFPTPVTAGSFTVNGAQVTIATSDSLQQVFGKIATATNNAVTASYDTTSDKITLTSATSGQPIVLGSGADTSNFLQAAGLYNNGTGSVSSNTALGSVQLSGTMANADLTTAVTDGGSGNGAFTINGVTINFNASTDNLQNVLDRINNSSAGVTASYDSQNKRFNLTNKTTGDTGITMQDVTGNFLAATGLAGGSLARGQNLLYNLNGSSQQLVSQSNTLTQASSNITGLSVTALATNTPSTPVTVTVGSDTSKLNTAINQFVTDYNKVQSYITSQQAVTTAADGTVTAGLLTADQGANEIASSLRSLTSSVINAAGSSGAVKQLADLGIQTNGKDNTLALSDAGALSTALSTNLSAVKSFFSDATSGLSTQLATFFTNTIGDTGTLTIHQTNLTTQSTDITTQISNLENKITADSAQWTTEFQNMETAQASVNQQLTYLSQAVSNGSL